MNIIKIQNQLKGVPDDTLVGYVQNPTGQVPTYLALSELQRRKEMRNSYQANKPEEKTVAEDLVEEAQPQQPQMEGVAGLPEAQPMMQAMAPPPEMPMQQMAQGGLAELDVGDMFNEQSYADGGIVAFADGGDTEKGMNIDNLPSLNVNTGLQSMGGQDGKDYALKTLMSTLMGRGLGVQQPGMEGLLKAFPSKNSNIDYSNFDMLRTPGTLTTPDTLRQALGLAGELYEKKPQGMAQGGEVKRFVKGGMPDEYGVIMPTVPTLDDLLMQTQEAQRAFGVDPDFYKKTLEESKTERLKELADAKKMDQAQLLLAMGSAFAGTPTFGKALSVAGERAAPIIGAMGKNQREINSLYKMADRKSLEAQQAQARGDAAGAQKAINEKENLLLNAQMEEAKLKSAEGIASTKAKATIAGKEGDLNSKIYDKAQKDFASTFPSGAASGVFLSNPGFIQFVKNIYLKNAQDYIRSGTMPSVPSESQLLDMFNKGKSKSAAVKPASKLSGEDSPLAATRPKNIQSILDKYPATGSRSKNTQEELDQPWDLVGQGLED